MTRDVSKFSARRFPQTQERLDIIEHSKPAHELFVMYRIDAFITGYETQEAYIGYRDYCKCNGFQGIQNINTFGKNIKPWVKKIDVRRGGRRHQEYKLNDLGLKHFRAEISEWEQDRDADPDNIACA
jgi:hypothetical protein